MGRRRRRHRRGDYAEAVRFDEPRAQIEIGLQLAAGQVIAENKVSALKWLILAAINGEANAAMHRDIVAADLSPAERQEADRLAHAWSPRE